MHLRGPEVHCELQKTKAIATDCNWVFTPSAKARENLVQQVKTYQIPVRTVARDGRRGVDHSERLAQPGHGQRVVHLIRVKP